MRLALILLAASMALATGARAEGPGMTSVFYPPALVARAAENARRDPWAAAERDRIVAAAQPWMRLSDDQLWGFMFGNTIKRSWMVWSNGYCPACRKPVPMYTWRMDALKEPWKVRCPHCGEAFPKNDFGAFYRSGLDAHGIFDPKRADRRLLFNTAHPDPADPLHTFGVDDGEGYVADGHRWRFIGAYLIYGQWKQAVYGGIRQLAAAYVVTGDRAYAHRALVLLDRVADIYPTMDFGREGVMYEGPPSAGYVSTWHDACEETRELALAWDEVRGALPEDAPLVAFLAEKARRYALDNPKVAWQDVRRNIEDRILRDALANQKKIYSNYPRTQLAVATLMAVLDWPRNRAEVLAYLDPVLTRATAVDGVTGEKGLAGYSAFTIRGIALLLAQYARMDPQFLPDLLRRHPRLHAMYRFHVDTRCLDHYYPEVGDTGGFAQPVPEYVGVAFSKHPGLDPSMYGFLWQLYTATGDAAFAQTLYDANGRTTDGLPYDLFAEDAPGFRKQVAEVIAKDGPAPKLASVNLREWHLAILRAGQGPDARAVWLSYDAGGPHGHQNGMNLGLFAKGLDLLPDFGYPPVQYGGWTAPRANWYRSTAAHNTVVVDGANQQTAAGQTTLWADGAGFHAVRASGPALVKQPQYERTVALVDVSDRDSYVLDIFRVVGGTDHARFLHGAWGPLTAAGLLAKNGAPAPDYGHGAILRDFRGGAVPAEGWTADWTEPAGGDKETGRQGDKSHGAADGSGNPQSAIRNPQLRLTDLTRGAHAYTCEAWVSVGGYDATEEAWIPCTLVRRTAADGGAGAGPLASTFVAVLEPYAGTPDVAGARRLPVTTPDGAAYGDATVAVEARLADGRRDLLVAADAEDPLGARPSLAADHLLAQRDWGLVTDGELCHVRRGRDGRIERLTLCRGTRLTVGAVELTLKARAELVEVAFERGRARVVGGDASGVPDVRVAGRSVLAR